MPWFVVVCAWRDGFVVVMLSCRAGGYLKGVFPVDRLPPLSPRIKTSLVVNLSPHHRPGSHFIALDWTGRKGAPVRYFDSYGLPVSPLLLRYLPVWTARRLRKVMSFPIQSFGDSLFCGWYCAAYLLTVSQRRWSLKKWRSAFHPRPAIRNDTLVTFLLKRLEKDRRLRIR